MFKADSQKQTGAGLLEMLLVLVIVAIMLVISVRYYLNYKRTENIGNLQSTVGQLMNALNSYYFMHCWKMIDGKPVVDVTLVDIPKLQKAGLLDPNFYNPPSWALFSAKIENKATGGGLFYVLKVMVVINIDDKQNKILAGDIRSALNADMDPDSSLGNIVTWTRVPSHSMDDLNSRQWIMNQGPGQQLMSGRLITAVNAGTGSKFWILNSNLQSFTKTSTGEPPLDEGKTYYAACPN